MMPVTVTRLKKLMNDFLFFAAVIGILLILQPDILPRPGFQT